MLSRQIELHSISSPVLIRFAGNGVPAARSLKQSLLEHKKI